MDNNFSKYYSLDVLKLYDDPQFNCKQHVILNSRSCRKFAGTVFKKVYNFIYFFNKVLYINNPLTSFAMVQIC